MTQTKDYAPVLPKIGAERSKFISEAKIKSLIDTNFQEFAAQLRDTTYQTQIAKLSLPLSSRKLERAFKENLIEAYKKIIGISPKKAEKYLSVYILRFKLENIKTLIKATIANLSFEQKVSRINLSIEDDPKNRAVIEEAAKFSTIREVVNAFKKTEYEPALNEGLQNYEKNRSTASFDISIDQIFYEKLGKNYQSLPKKEKPHAAFYASSEIDSFILLTLLRGKALNYDANFLRTAVPDKGVKLSHDIVEALVTANDLDSTLNIILKTRYSKFFVKAQSPEETIANAEKTFQKSMLKHAKASTILEIFNIGAPLSFMTLKAAEVHNLIALSVGVEGAVNSEKIQNQLLF